MSALIKEVTEVVRKEIVPGGFRTSRLGAWFSILEVEHDCVVGQLGGFTHATEQYMKADDLRELSTLFIQLAEVLEENNKEVVNG